MVKAFIAKGGKGHTLERRKVVKTTVRVYETFFKPIQIMILTLLCEPL